MSRRSRGASDLSAPGRSGARIKIVLGLVVSVIVVLLPSFVTSALLLDLFEQVAIFAMLALALNLIFGFTGQISIGQAGFYAIGAYSAAILETKAHVPWFFAWPAAVVITVILAWVLSLPLLRLKGHYLALGSLAFGLIVYTVLSNAVPLTGGSDGIILSASRTMGPVLAERLPYVIFAAVVLTFWAMRNLVKSSFGRALRALRDDEDGAEAMGIATTRYKSATFAFAAGVTAVAGVLFAHRAQVVTPEVFSIHASIQILMMVVIGGMASNLGSVLGAAVVVLLPFYLQLFKDYQNLLYAVLVLLVLLIEPKGIAGLVDAGRLLIVRLFRRRSVSSEGSGIR